MLRYIPCPHMPDLIFMCTKAFWHLLEGDCFTMSLKYINAKLKFNTSLIQLLLLVSLQE